MKLTAAEEYLNELFEQFVPDSGMADTLGGEIVRAIERLLWRNWNDGDHVGIGYGNETCNGSYRFLCNHIDNFPDLYCIYSDKDYDKALSDAANLVAEHLKKYPSYFSIPNKEDSRVVLPEDYELEKEEWDEEEY